MEINSLIWLIFAHFIGDWGIATSWLHEQKTQRFFPMLAHCMIYTGCVSIALQHIGIFALWSVLLILFSHCLIDIFKIRLHEKFVIRDTLGWTLDLDQFLHIMILVLIWFVSS